MSTSAEIPVSGQAGALAASRRLVRALAGMGRRRFLAVLGLTTLGGLVEGAGVLALVPVLKLLGVGSTPAAGQTGTPELVFALGGYVLLAIFAALVVQGRTVSSQSLQLDFLDRLRADLHRAILAMEWRAFRRLRAAELQQTVMGEVARIGLAVTMLFQLAAALITLPFVLAATLWLSWPLTLAALGVSAIVMMLTRHLGARGYRLGRELGAANRATMADLADDLAGLRGIKAFGAEESRAAIIAGRFRDVRHNMLGYQRTRAREQALLQMAAAVAAAAVLGLAVTVLRLPMAEALVLVVAYARLLQTALKALVAWRQLTGAVAALSSYEETLSLCRSGAEQHAGPGATPLPLSRAITLSGVAVRHDGDEAPAALEALDAVLPAGRTTALIGPSGAGKSTLADLISGLLSPDAGRVLIDDTELSAELRHSWRRQVAVVPQDPFVFHDTVAANLRLARPEADDAALWRTLEAAALAGVVRALPQGLETVIGDRGVRLSGGERQRLVLARALLREPALLVLDEATASLDGETEALVAATLAGLAGRTTVLVIAHRPSTVRHADHVLVLEAGSLIAAGTWQEVARAVPQRLGALGMAES
ncbi:ABC transporter ATP-binding protein [Radicibacter daui]|uniref:ABC transporter ATP-binding protein n=1 Tax=Radicibacter daui TaxID=3064829 RepID=UPI00404692F1